MYYCGKECQQKDWIQHKFECKFFKKNLEQLNAIEQTDDIFFRFVLRLNLCLEHNVEILHERRKFLNDDENSAVCLDGIFREKYKPKNEQYDSHFIYMFQQFKLLKMEWHPVRMAICHKLCHEYGLTIFDYEMNKLGFGLYIAESQLEHSCSPSAKLLFNGTQLVMRSTKRIKTGEKITINNIKFSRPPEWLVPEFRMHYNFSYMCIECASENRYHSLRGLRQIFFEMFSASKSNDLNEICRTTKEMISILNNICYECDLSLILQKINFLEDYVIIHNDVEELSVAELAKQTEIKLPSAYNEIFENTYFNREEKPHVTIVKALANVEFNVKN
uniref:Histone-lysine N-methyltransferase SMYD3-like n=1 Tax=Dermatophagoides pteronyssinus TaxID=6956 RepID=A0A6P6XQJ7_DERPT|nr:histone-lysine N-methyltransferase SMYD3-like [Dermatophagoides pteronyssinus]